MNPVLAYAADLIEEDGWHRNQPHPDPKKRGGSHRRYPGEATCRHDISGAVTLAAAEYARRELAADGTTPETPEARAVHYRWWTAAHAELHRRLGTAEAGEWNDRPGRTAAEVLAVLRSE